MKHKKYSQIYNIPINKFVFNKLKYKLLKLLLLIIMQISCNE